MRKFVSVGFFGIPESWKIRTGAYVGGYCDISWSEESVSDRHFSCLESDSHYLTGASYEYTSKEGDTAAPEMNGTEQLNKKSLLLDDGSEYSLDGISEFQYTELVNMLVNITTFETLPDPFRHLTRIKAEEILRSSIASNQLHDAYRAEQILRPSH